MEERYLTQEALEGYRAHLREEERAESTAGAYLRDAAAFLCWLSGRAVTKEAVCRWRAHLLEKGNAPATVNRKLASLSGLFRFLHWEDCRVRYLTLQRSTFRTAGRELSEEEYLRLLNTAHARGRERLALIMETLCAAGIRVSELRWITLESVERNSAVVHLKGKLRTVLLPGRLCEKLTDYAEAEHITGGPIFRTRTGRCPDRSQIWREMKALCAEAGVAPSKVFPHNLRHLFAVSFYRLCQDLVDLADLLGHSSLNTTRIYLRTSGTEIVDRLNSLRLSP